MTLPAYLAKGILGPIANFTTWFNGGQPATVVYTNAGAPTSGGSGTLNGVAVPGSLLLDTTGHVLYLNTNTKASPTWSPLQPGSVATGLTASTTHTLAGALALTATVNFVSTVASSGDAVSLPAMAVGGYCEVFNDGASPMAVFPSASGIAIDGGSAGASVTLTNAKRCIYTQKSATAIESAQLGVASA